MDDDPLNSDSNVGSKRRITTDTEQEEEVFLQLQLSSSLPVIITHQQDSTPQDHQEETTMDDSSPKKKAKCFSLLSEGNQELGLRSFTEKEKIDNAGNEEGSFPVQEVDTQVNAIEVDVGFVLETDKKEHQGTCSDFEEKRVIKGEDLDSENVLEAKRKRLLREFEVGKRSGAKTCTGNISGFATNSSNIVGIKGLGMPVRGSLKIEVIDDTALIGSFPLSITGNGSVKDEKNKGKQENEGKKAKNSRGKGKNARKVLGEAVRHMESTKIVEVENCRRDSKNQSKIMYSRKALEALRFAKVVEQQNLWRDVYNGLATDVIREYDDLGSWKHQKNISLSSDTRHSFVRKADSPAVMSLTCTRDIGVEDAFIAGEEECIDDDDSGEDYASILRPAFMVEGEPDFGSGPPEDGLEYLRRVRSRVQAKTASLKTEEKLRTYNSLQIP